ncbi:BTAD domain-containing putative transcriptional regulator [Micromonospora fluostatini]|uniref:BTAD domain-containing putative transcriptional regulator n=1 Tax=Micromonospora sp. JCM 30529 TaxID=3421643 RepID=UPI003D16D1D1
MPARPPTVELRLLGPVEVRVHGTPVALPGRRRRALLALLALHAGRPLALGVLLERIWGPEHPPTALAALRNCVSALRKLLPAGGPVRLATVDQGYRLQADRDTVDVAALRRLLPRAQLKLGAGEAPEAASLLAAASRLWRGPALADLLDSYADWPEVAELEELRLRTIEERIDADLALGRHRALVAELAGLVRAHPGRERLYRQHMTALYRANQQAHAITAYHDARTALVRHTGRESTLELDELYRSILEQRADLPPRVDGGPPPAPTGPVSPVRPAGPSGRLRRVTLLCLRMPTGGEARPAHTLPVVHANLRNLGGRIEYVLGSTVVASFGLVSGRGDTAGFAVYAALAVRAAVAGRPGFAAAVVTGPVLVREVPTPEPTRPRLVGQVVDAGMDLLAATPDGTVRVDDTTRRASRRLIRYLPDTAGADGPDHAADRAWTARAAWLLPRDPHRRRARPLVGRQAELALLAAILDHVPTSRRPHLVTLVGPAGTGKTRLALATVAAALARLPALTGYIARVGGGDDPTVRLERLPGPPGPGVAPAPPGRRPAARQGLRHVVAALRTVTPDGVAPAAGWRQVVRDLLGGATVVIVLDDLHDAPNELLDAVTAVTATPAALPLLTVVTAREPLSRRRPDWGAGLHNAIVIPVPPLAPAEPLRLVRDVAADAEGPPGPHQAGPARAEPGSSQSRRGR